MFMRYHGGGVGHEVLRAGEDASEDTPRLTPETIDDSEVELDGSLVPGGELFEEEDGVGPEDDDDAADPDELPSVDSDSQHESDTSESEEDDDLNDDDYCD